MSSPQACNDRLWGSLDVERDPLLSELYSHAATKKECITEWRKRIAACRWKIFSISSTREAGPSKPTHTHASESYKIKLWWQLIANPNPTLKIPRNSLQMCMFLSVIFVCQIPAWCNLKQLGPLSPVLTGLHKIRDFSTVLFPVTTGLCLLFIWQRRLLLATHCGWLSPILGKAMPTVPTCHS